MLNRPATTVLLVLLLLLQRETASAQRVACGDPAVEAHRFERVLCALHRQKFAMGKIRGRARDTLRRQAMAARTAEVAVPKLYQLAIGEDTAGLEIAWRKEPDRLTRFFIAMLFYTQGGGEHERTTAFRRLPVWEFSGQQQSERAQEIALVAQYRPALAAELVALLEPFKKSFWKFSHWEYNASAAGVWTTGSLDVLDPRAAPAPGAQ